mmetsp:Transcript_32690/g.70815  ORF Transcript_32690/g.70815 Transcript_32690/m.70815 type:complete len:95 (-) Transcript_32690:27-311(-)
MCTGLSSAISGVERIAPFDPLPPLPAVPPQESRVPSNISPPVAVQSLQDPLNEQQPATIFRCACGGSYTQSAQSRKNHFMTKMHREWQMEGSPL